MIEFRLGLEVCVANPPEVLRGARFGLVMNQASIDSGFRTADEVLKLVLIGWCVFEVKKNLKARRCLGA